MDAGPDVKPEARPEVSARRVSQNSRRQSRQSVEFALMLGSLSDALEARKNEESKIVGNPLAVPVGHRNSHGALTWNSAPSLELRPVIQELRRDSGEGASKRDRRSSESSAMRRKKSSGLVADLPLLETRERFPSQGDRPADTHTPIARRRSKTLVLKSPTTPLIAEPKAFRRPKIIAEPEAMMPDLPRSPFQTHLSAPPTELHLLWESLDTTQRGYLTYDEVSMLLSELGVEMDEWKEMEFFHLVDTDRNGKITYREFASAFMKFKSSGQFRSAWSSVRLACCIAGRSGVTTEQVVKVWQKYDSKGDEELGTEQVKGLLSELGLQHTEDEVEELIREFDVDNSGKLSFQEFVGMFTGDANVRTEEEERFDLWMNEVRTMIASRQMQTRIYETQEQQQIASLESRRLWYNTRYTLLLFMYTLLNILVPTFLVAYMWSGGPVDHSSPLYALLHVSDIVLYWWVYMKFHLPTETRGAPVYHQATIRTLYFRSTFPLDCAAAMPLDLLVVIVWPDGFLNPALRLNKLLLIWYMNGWFNVNFGRILGPTWVRIVNALFWWAVMAHMVACVFDRVALNAGDADTKFVLTIDEYSKLPPEHRYLQAYSYSVNTMAGLSRGVFPRNDLQAAFSLLTVIMGVFVYALVLAVVSYGLSVKTQEAKFKAVVDEVKDVLSTDVASGRLPTTFVQDAVSYHKHVFHSTGLFHIDEDLLYDLPAQLSVGIALVIGRQTIARVPIFSEVCSTGNEEFIYALQQCLQLVVAPPCYYIIELGEEGREMYFITSGQCSVLDDTGEVVHVLRAGDMFGEIALLASVPRTATIRADTFTNLLELKRDDFDLVMSSFPLLLKSIEDKAKDRIRHIRKTQKQSASSAESTLDSPTTERKKSSESAENSVVSSEGSSGSSGDDMIDWIRKNSKHASLSSDTRETFTRKASRFGSRRSIKKVRSNGSLAHDNTTQVPDEGFTRTFTSEDVTMHSTLLNTTPPDSPSNIAHSPLADPEAPAHSPPVSPAHGPSSGPRSLIAAAHSRPTELVASEHDPPQAPATNTAPCPPADPQACTTITAPSPREKPVLKDDVTDFITPGLPPSASLSPAEDALPPQKTPGHKRASFKLGILASEFEQTQPLSPRSEQKDKEPPLFPKCPNDDVN